VRYGSIPILSAHIHFHSYPVVSHPFRLNSPLFDSHPLFSIPYLFASPPVDTSRILSVSCHLSTPPVFSVSTPVKSLRYSSLLFHLTSNQVQSSPYRNGSSPLASYPYLFASILVISVPLRLKTHRDYSFPSRILS